MSSGVSPQLPLRAQDLSLSMSRMRLASTSARIFMICSAIGDMRSVWTTCCGPTAFLSPSGLLLLSRFELVQPLPSSVAQPRCVWSLFGIAGALLVVVFVEVLLSDRCELELQPLPSSVAQPRFAESLSGGATFV